MLEACDIRSYAESLTPRVEPRVDASVILDLRRKEKEGGWERELIRARFEIEIGKCAYRKISSLTLLGLNVSVKSLRMNVLCIA